jgi:hypothetical protein
MYAITERCNRRSRRTRTNAVANNKSQGRSSSYYYSRGWLYSSSNVMDVVRLFGWLSLNHSDKRLLAWFG